MRNYELRITNYELRITKINAIKPQDAPLPYFHYNYVLPIPSFLR